MARGSVLSVDYFRRVEAEILLGPGMRAAIESVADGIAREAAVLAPKDTGAGAASIHSEVVLSARVDISAGGVTSGAVWEGRVSWSPDHYYMYMQEKGWRAGRHKIRARPFLKPAAKRRRSV